MVFLQENNYKASCNKSLAKKTILGMILYTKNLHNISEVYVRYGLHQEMKAYRDGLEIYQV